MLKRSTWIVLGIFAVLILGVFLWQRYGKTEELIEPTPTTQLSELVFDLGDQKIVGFRIDGADGSSILLGQDPTSKAWMVGGQPAELADVTQIDTVASSLAFMMVNRQLPTQPPLDSMGLDLPPYTITLDLDSGKQVVLSIGKLIPTGTGYYARVDENPVMVIAKTDIDSIVSLLTTPPLTTTYTPTATATATMTATSTPKPSMTFTPTPEATSESEVTTTQTP